MARPRKPNAQRLAHHAGRRNVEVAVDAGAADAERERLARRGRSMRLHADAAGWLEQALSRERLGAGTLDAATLVAAGRGAMLVERLMTADDPAALPSWIAREVREIEVQLLMTPAAVRRLGLEAVVGGAGVDDGSDDAMPEPSDVVANVVRLRERLGGGG